MIRVVLWVWAVTIIAALALVASSVPAHPAESGADPVTRAERRRTERAELFLYRGAIIDALEAQRDAAIVARWSAVHQCEQPDSWTVDGTFGNGLRGGGGLGLSNGFWLENGGAEFAPIPGQATPWQQMLIAQRGYERWGASPWGCTVPP